MAVPPGLQEQESLVDERHGLQKSASHPAFSSSDSDEPTTGSLDVGEDEADQVVGVSMGHTQSRMKARQTPAEEKNRVMERSGGYFASIPDVDRQRQSEGVYLSELTAEPEPAAIKPEGPEHEHEEPDLGKDLSQTQNQLPKDAGGRSSFTRSILKNGLPLRPRAWSGDNFKRFFPDFGSLAKRSTLSFKSNSGSSRDRSDSGKLMGFSSKLALDRTANGSSEEKTPNWSDGNGANEEPISELRPVGGGAAAKHSYARRPSAPVPGRPASLRRSSSDQSLFLRASSTASSLDQRYEFEDVHSQVNVRFKAIKDTLQDSSSRLLNMPTLNLQEIRNDWANKPFMPDAAQRWADQHSDGPKVVHEANGERGPHPHPQPGRSNTANLNPELAEATDEMTGDVVVMGGYRGSILRSAKPPRRQLWVPMKVGLNLRKVDLEVGLSHEDEERMEESIIPSGVLSHIGPVDICRRLLRQLQRCDNAMNGDLRVWDYGYDWRLSPHLLANRLVQYVEGLPCNAPDVPREKRGAYVIAHSLGGLIARHAVNQRPELFAGVVYAGVPQHCVNILGPLRNGDDVLLSSRVLTAQVNFTFRTSFALLPEDGHCFFDKQTKEEYPVDFFDPQTWDDHHLSPCVKGALPPYTAGKGLKDSLDMMGKRFSTVLSGKDSPDEPDEPPLSSYHTASEQPSALSTRPPPPPPPGVPDKPGPSSTATPIQNTMQNPTPNLDGLVGPTTTQKPATPASTATTIPRDAALAYLDRTLSEVLQFKHDLAFNPAHHAQNRYPPFAVLFGKSVPTVYGARVWSRDQIKHQDAYDDLSFAAGDGVCLASAAMMPPGYRIIRDGLVRSERGHVGLLGDLDGVGKCLKAVIRGRKVGVGLEGSGPGAGTGAKPGPGENEDRDGDTDTFVSAAEE